MKAIKNYLWRILIAIDQLVNVVAAPMLNGLMWLEMTIRGQSLSGLWRFGMPDETLSSVFGKNAGHNYFCRGFAWILNTIDKGHTAKAIEDNEGRRFK